MAGKSEIRSAIERAIEQVNAAERTALPKLEKAVSQPLPMPRVRYRFTLTVLWALLVSLATIAIFYMCTGDKDKASFLFDIVKVAILPLVTLMIGHYFGSKSD